LFAKEELSMLELLELQDIGPTPHMRFEFAPRLNLLTGDNGLGKSFVLDLVWWGLTRRWARAEARPTRFEPGLRPAVNYTSREAGRKFVQRWVFDRQKWRWWLTLEDVIGAAGEQFREQVPASHMLVLYVQVDGSFSAWDPLRNLQNVPAYGSTLIERPLPFDFAAGEVWDGLEIKTLAGTSVVCNGLIRDWMTWRDRRPEVFESFTRVLECLSPHPERERLRPGEPVRLSPDDARDVPTIKLPYEQIPVVLASAGMKRVLALAYLLVWLWHEHKEAARLKGVEPAKELVVLMDEVETHLHPQWQRVILPALLKVIPLLEESLSVQVIATTHAPLVLASVEPLFDETRDALFHFEVEEAQVKVARQHWRPRGDASAWLKSEVFGLAQDRSLEAERAIQAAMQALRQPSLPIEEVRRIHHELRAVLKDTDPFWPRWLARAERAGVEP
jgi:hypothetical protein